MGFLEERDRDPILKSIPVIIITARESSEIDVVECLAKGAEDFLSMPPSYEILKARIENALERRRQQKREAELRNHLEKTLLEVKEAEEQAERLLRSIFPPEAVRELKQYNRITPRRHEDVAIVMSDIVGFTPYCESNEPAIVVQQVEKLVEAQETIAESFGVDKIKTIGDAFMGAAGLKSPGDESLLDCVRCARAFVDLPQELGLEWQIRVGVHCGPIIAGKVGQEKFSYDLWGDTVNTAARIQSAASPGTLFVSSDIWQRVASNCTGVSQGLLELKGKTKKMEVFRVDEVSPRK